MRRRLAILLLALLLAWSAAACGMSGGAPEGETLAVYYAADPKDVGGGDILAVAVADWNAESRQSATEQSRAAVELLLGGCTAADFVSPIPGGTQLLSCTVAGGSAVVDLSEAYGQLTGMALSIADYCITLTLTQIPGVNMVRILVNGRELAYRSSNTLLAGDALLTSTEDAVRTFAARLYFSDGAGQLQGTDRLLTLYEGQSRGAVIVEALRAAPADSGLRTLLPEGFAVLSVWAENGICYLNLPDADEALLPETAEAQAILVQSIVRSLCSISDISKVQILIDGELRMLLGTVDISEPLTGTQG